MTSPPGCDPLPSILVIEDDPAHSLLISRALAPAGAYRIRHAASLRDGRAAIAAEAPTLVLSDLNLSDGKAFELLGDPPHQVPFPLLVLTSHGDEQTAVQSMRSGALDYVVKSEEAFANLPRTIERALREWRLAEEHRAAEAALRDSEERFRVLFASAPDAFVIHDVEGLVLDGNRAAEEMVGRPRIEVIGKTLLDLGFQPPADPDTAARILELQKLGKETGPEEIVVARPDGSRVHVEVRTVPIQLQGNVVVLAIARDISARRHADEARRRLEEQLHHAMKMDAIGRLAGGIAHDFNNLLTVITSAAEMLGLEMRRGEPMTADLGEIKHAAQRAASLTGQLLAFSRKQIIAPVIVDLNELLAGAVRMLERIIGEDIDLDVSPAEGLGVVNIDPNQAEQVLVNLAVNARDAMSKGGKLSFATSNATVDEAFAADKPEARAGEYVVLKVSDTGGGIPQEVIPRIFEPFFTTKDQGRGTGLGLAIIYGMVTQNGGFVVVSSELGRGTTFELYLPRVEGDREISPRAVATTLPRGTETILVVEDEKAVLSLATRFLRRQGFEVIAADRGGDALLLLKDPALHVDLLLTDVILPVMDGRKLYEELRLLRPGLRVVFMSGYTDDVIARRGVLEPGIAFVQKPFTLDALVRKVREVLDAPVPTGEG
jgi:PAS domain S-box-containing protein